MAIDYGTVIDGIARSDSINQNGQVLDMESHTALLDPNSYVFEALLRQLGSKITTNQMKHEYREKRLIPSYVSLTAEASSGGTTITVDDYTRIKNDFYLYSPTTNDLLLVQDASIDASVTVVLASDGSSALPNTIASGSKIIILGEAHAEGEEVPEAYSNQSINKFNYVMQKDRRIEQTDIEEAIEHYDSSEERMAQRKQAFIEYKRDQNLLHYVGQSVREIVSAVGPRRHCCSGIIELFTENVYDLSGAGSGLTLTTLSNIMGSTKYHGSSSETKMGLFGTNPWTSISALPVSALRVSPMEKKWGINISKIITGYGEMNIAYDPVLSADNGLADRFFVFDTKHTKQMCLKGQNVRMITDIPNLSTVHRTVDAITGTFGLQVKFPELHAQGSGVS